MPIFLGRLQAWRTRLDWVTDPVIALLVVALSAPPLLDTDPHCDCATAHTWGLFLLALQAAPLIVRRRYPFTAGLAAGLASAAYGVSALPDPPLPAAGLVALYSVAAHASRRLALVSAGIAAVSITVALLIDQSDDYQDVMNAYLLFAAAWLLGNGARNRRERAADLEERAIALERTRTAEAERAVVQERNRIAREMHDVVAHHVSMMVVQAEAGPVVVGQDPQRAVETFDTISATGKEVLTQMRHLLGVLRSEPGDRLAPQPTLAEVGQLVDGVRPAGREVGMTFDLEVLGDARPLPPSVELSGYRLLQEALTNALRHAGPGHVSVVVEYRPDAVRLEVRDDGSARPGRPLRADGHGLIAMRERVALVGGDVSAGPRPEGGWHVQALLPLDGARTSR
jgi:signal transduction histidine kinase